MIVTVPSFSLSGLNGLLHRPAAPQHLPQSASPPEALDADPNQAFARALMSFGSEILESDLGQRFLNVRYPTQF